VSRGQLGVGPNAVSARGSSSMRYNASATAAPATAAARAHAAAEEERTRIVGREPRPNGTRARTAHATGQAREGRHRGDDLALLGSREQSYAAVTS